MFHIDTQSLDREPLKSLKLGLLCVVFVVSITTFLNLHYTVNDNVGIIDFITGGYPIPYVGIVLLGLLHQAYVAVPTVPWFGLMLYALQTLSLFLWLMLAWRVFRARWLSAAFTLVVLGYYLGFIVSLDFTATSIMLCTASFAWACVQAVERRPGILRFLGPGAVFAIGMMVRPQGAPGALAYAWPVALAAAITCARGRAFVPEAKRLGLAALIFLLPAIFNFGVDATWREAMLTPQEVQYEAFNSAGTELSHLSNARISAIRQDSPLLASVHWTQHDLTYFQHWEFLDERIYTTEAMQTLATSAPPAQLSFADLGRLILQRLPRHNMTFLLLAACMPIFLYLFWGLRAEAAIGLLLPVYCVGLTTFMYLLFAFHARLELPFEVGLGFSGLLLAGLLADHAGCIGSRGFRVAACASLLIALSGAGLSIRDTLDDQHEVARVAGQTQSMLQILNTGFAGSTILVQPNSLDLSVLSPLYPFKRNFRSIDLGWNTFSPRFYQQIGVLGIQHGYQLVDAFIDRPDAYILGPQKWRWDLLSYVSNGDKRDIQVVMVAPNLSRLTENKK